MHPLLDIEIVLIRVFAKLEAGQDIAAAMSVCRSWRQVFEAHEQTSLAQQHRRRLVWIQSRKRQEALDFYTILDDNAPRRACMHGKRHGIFFGDL